MELESVTEKAVDRQLSKLIDKKAIERINSLKNIDNFTDDEEDYEIHQGDADFDEVETELDKVNLAKLSPDEATKVINREDVSDIFIDIGNAYMDRGEVVSYTIIDNPTKAQLGTEYHPFSYDDLKMKYGGGHFKVVARHKGKYIKTEQKYIAGPKKDFNAHEEKQNNSAQAPSLDFQAIVEQMTTISEKNSQALLKTQEESRRREMELQKEIRESQIKSEQSNIALLERVLLSQQNQKNSSAELISALAPILAPLLPKILAPKEKDNSVDVMMKVQELNMKMIEKMNESNQKMFETLQKQIEKISDTKSSSSTDGMNPFEVMKMIKDAESDGFEKFRMIKEMAKEEAEERAYNRGERDDTEEKKGSAVDTLITTLTPMLATKMMGGGGPATFNNPPVSTARNPQVITNRSSLSRQNIQTVQGTRNNAPRSQGNAVQANPTRKETGASQKSETGSEFSSISAVRPPSIFDELKSLPIPDKKEELKSNVIAVSPDERFSNIEKVKGIVFPIVIANSMDENATISKVSDLCVDGLLNSELKLSDILRDFDEMAISDIIRELPENYHEMLKDLHNDITSKLKTRIE